MPLYTEEDGKWNPANRFAGYNAEELLAYEDTLPSPRSAASGQARCSTTSNYSINYRKCGVQDTYASFVQSVNTHMKDTEGLVIRGSTRAAYFTSKSHMLATGIPSWSKNRRPAKELYLSTLTDEQEQCMKGRISTSICMSSANKVHNMNPWTGGYFNPLEYDGAGQQGGVCTD